MHHQHACSLASETAPSICHLPKLLKIKPTLSSSTTHLNTTEAAPLAKLDRIFVEKYQREVGRRDLQRSEALRVLKVHSHHYIPLYYCTAGTQ